MKKMELLAPAGSYDSFVAAINAGADAVYAAGSLFGARAFARNLTQEELLRAVDYAHLHKKKLYLTVNTLLKPEELHGQLDPFLKPLYEAGLDGVIVQDPGVFLHLRTQYPQLPLHVSTQMTVTGPDGALFLKQCGAQRIVPARELSLAEIAAIKQTSGLEVEVFVHGALCYCYSGQCFFSSLLGGRSGNRGRCAQPCRLPYKMDQRSGKLLSPKDLCALTLLPDLWKAGVDSLKIEGRMKSAAYTAGIVRIYRKYLERLYADPQHYQVDPADLRTLQAIYDRGGNGVTTGYFYRYNGADMMDPSPHRTAECQSPQNAPAGQGMSLHSKPASSYDPTAGLQALIREQPALSVDGMVSLYVGQAAALSLWNEEVQVTVTGDIVQEAKNQPLTEEVVAAQLQKTGGSFFNIHALYCEMDPAVFLPKQALNSLRRAALDALSHALLDRYRRSAQDSSRLESNPVRNPFFGCEKEKSKPAPSGNFTHTENQAAYLLAASVETKAQFTAAVVAEGVARIDLDAAMVTGKEGLLRSKAAYYAEEAKKQQKKLFLRFPPIFRRAQRARFLHALEWLAQYFDGVVVRSIDSYAFCLSQLPPEMPVCCDFTMYTFQAEAAAFWRQGGRSLRGQTDPASGQTEPDAAAASQSHPQLLLTSPIELNAHELAENHGLYDELIVYGRYPMMVSANCLAKTTGRAFCSAAEKGGAAARESCIPGETVLYLVDRYRKRFPVKPYCADCYNVIYNSLPTSLLQDQEAIDRIGVRTLRLLFTTEDGEQTGQVLSCFYRTMLWGQTSALPFAETTRGHFKRGVD